MVSWIKLVMNYKEIENNIKKIKESRENFIKQFKNNKLFVIDSLKNSKHDNELNTIRVHKYLTSNGILPKVKTARFLEQIGLSENTKIFELDDRSINKISIYTEQNDNNI